MESGFVRGGDFGRFAPLGDLDLKLRLGLLPSGEAPFGNLPFADLVAEREVELLGNNPSAKLTIAKLKSTANTKAPRPKLAT